MRMPKILIAAVLATSTLGLGGCKSFYEAPPTLEDTSVDEKALYVAEAAFSGASAAIEQAVDAGLIKGEVAAEVDRYYTAAYNALVMARYAQEAGDSGTLLQQAILVQELVAKIFAKIPR